MAGKFLGTSANQAPVSRHPAFPAVVALWFAALFGIGTLVLPATLFDNLAGLFGMESLGLGARIAIAIVVGAAGAVLGVFLARKVVRDTDGDAPEVERAGPVVRDRETKRPISALEELGPEGLDEPLAQNDEDMPRAEPMPGRRRALAVTDEGATNEYVEPAPVADADEPEEAADIETADEEDEDALDLGAFANGDGDLAPVDGEQPDPERPFALPAAEEPAAEARPLDASEADAVEDEPAIEAEPEPVAAESEESPFAALQRQYEASAAEEEDHTVQDDAAEPVEPPADLRFGMPQPVDEPVADETGPRHPLADPAWLAEPESESEPGEAEAIPDADPEPTPRGVAEKSLAELGMVELVERFALSLQRHTEAPAEASEEPQARPFGIPKPVEAPEPETQDLAAEQPAETRRPAALEPLDIDGWDEGDEDEDDRFDLDFDLTAKPRPFAAPADQDDRVDPSGDEDEADNFGSLLKMKGSRGGAREMTELDDDDAGAVVFPGHENRRATPAADGPSRDAGGPAGRAFAQRPADGDSTEAALRDALAKLQKLSGAA